MGSRAVVRIYAVGRFSEGVCASGRLAGGLRNGLKIGVFRTDQVINSPDIINPFFELFGLVTSLFKTNTQGYFWVHSGFHTIAQLVFVQVGVSVDENAVLRLHLNCPIPEEFVALVHLQQLDAGDLFPIFGEIQSSEFRHECRECQSEQALVIKRDPVLDASISQPSEDLPNLFVRSYILGIKVTEAGVFVFMHDGGRDITQQEEWDLRR